MPALDLPNNGCLHFSATRMCVRPRMRRCCMVHQKPRLALWNIHHRRPRSPVGHQYCCLKWNKITSGYDSTDGIMPMPTQPTESFYVASGCNSATVGVARGNTGKCGCVNHKLWCIGGVKTVEAQLAMSIVPCNPKERALDLSGGGGQPTCAMPDFTHPNTSGGPWR